MNLKKLNGWQRLWVVVSALWFVFSTLLMLSSVTRVRPEDLWALALFGTVPPFGVYLLGLGVAWVWRGFKLKRDG